MHESTGQGNQPTELRNSQYEYDLAGNQTAVIDSNKNKTIYTYDGLNRPCFRDQRQKAACFSTV
ncbi:hypothetical protein [Agathobaculum butyriciproducens]|uniref:hypothetical protein n=1 Tax=Agathobaculum butyriciproducens TaxID=1628085 RepID=UPI0036D21ABA